MCIFMCAYVYGKLDSNLIEDPPEGFLGRVEKGASGGEDGAKTRRFRGILKRGCGRGGTREGLTLRNG